MYKTLKRLTVVVVLALLAAMLMIPAAAMDFSVKPVLPENQRQNGSAFFDLMVRPGQTQDLVIEIGNTSDVDIAVLVETITASTSRSGQINYTSRGVHDETLKYSFEEMVSIPQDYYSIPAGTSIKVPISLTVPDEPFEGALLGSVRVLREATQEEKAAAGAIVNQYAHVTAVRIIQNENAEAINADFALGEITAELVNYRASIVAMIRNTQPMIIKGASATASIYEKGARHPIFEHSQETLEFAPNSVFQYSFVDEEGYGIEPGEYTAMIDVKYGGKTWSFEQDFTIPAQVAAIVNEGALNQYGQQRPAADAGVIAGIPLWGVIAIAVGAALFAAITVLIIVVAKRKPAIAA